MHSPWRACLLLSALLSPAAWGQGTPADFERARTFGSRFQNLVLNERLAFNWLKDGKGWYVRQVTRDTHEIMWVDARAKTKARAFDHARMARALNEASGQAVDASRLPLRQMSLSDDGAAVTFVINGEAYRVDRRTFAVSKGRPGEAGGLKAYAPEEVPRSGGGDDQTSITFVNQADRKLKIFWIQDDGVLREYKVIAPGETWSISTWVTHYWLVTEEDGTKLAAFKPDRNGSTAFLDGKRVPYTAPPPVVRGQSPDGRWIISFREQQAWIRDGSQAPRAITTQGVAGNAFRGGIYWSPDSKTVAFQQIENGDNRRLNIVITTPRDQFQPRLLTVPYAKPGDKLERPVWYLYRPEENRLMRVDPALYPNPFILMDEGWLDGQRFAFRYNERGHQRMRLVVVDAATGQARTAVEDVTRTFIDWTGKSFFQVLSGGNEAIWQSERSGWSHLERVDLRTGTRRPITQGNWVVRDVDRVDEENRQIWFTAGGVHAGQDPYHVHFGRVNFDGSGLTWLTRANGQHRAQFSPDGEWLLATYSRADLPPVHELRRVSDGALVMELEKADDSALRAAGWRTPIVFCAKGRDGVTDIWGLIYLPTTFDPAKKYAVVEDIYAGPHSAHVPKYWHVNSFGQQNAELGFIVVRIDGMGTSHRSKAFHDVAWQNIADAGFPDRIAWMKAAAKQVPQMDLTRVGIYGTSAGGQNALHAVLLHGDFYKLAVADCGCYDNRMDKIWWNEQWMGYPIGPHYEAQSGRTLAPRLKGDLMLVLGEEDTNVDPASTWQVVDALVQANKDFELVVLPNVGHGALGHPYAQRRFREFLVNRLIRGR